MSTCNVPLLLDSFLATSQRSQGAAAGGNVQWYSDSHAVVRRALRALVHLCMRGERREADERRYSLFNQQQLRCCASLCVWGCPPPTYARHCPAGGTVLLSSSSSGCGAEGYPTAASAAAATALEAPSTEAGLNVQTTNVNCWLVFRDAAAPWSH